MVVLASYSDMAALEDFEDFIREKVERERWTHEKLSAYLQRQFPRTKGFSARSLRRFCSLKDIHRTSRLERRSLDRAVTEAIIKVSILTC